MAADNSPAQDAGPTAFEELHERAKQMILLEQAGDMLSWDQQVTMPPDGAPARGAQRSTISKTIHAILTDERTGELLDELEEAELTHDQRAVVREVRREYEREISVPPKIVERHTMAKSDAQQTWKDAKMNSDFSLFAPTLKELREIRIKRAKYVNPDGSPHATMFDRKVPTVPLDLVEEIFNDLKAALIPLLEEIRENGAHLPRPFDGQTFPEAEQASLNHAALEFMGYPFNRGRLDTSAHPFTSGNQFDARVTTRYSEKEPLDALTATFHEYGHATYELGLPKDKYGSPLGTSRSEVHESQSRFWENHVGRSRPFWESFLPVFKEHLSGVDDLTAEEAYLATNRIYPDNTIRVQADEVTYHLHIILRHEIEAEFIDGTLPIEDIPERWNELMDEYLHVVPDEVANGPLQDVHWTRRFGGFSTYTIGSVLAAQLEATMEEDVNVEGCIRDQEFERLREWMYEHVHRHGQRYEATDLVEIATGEPLAAEYFIEYVEDKFRDIYDI